MPPTNKKKPLNDDVTGTDLINRPAIEISDARRTPESKEKDSHLVAAARVLQGTTMPEQAIQRIALAVESQKYKSVRDALEGKDFDWPWFDQCVEQFRVWGIWPESKAWEPHANEPKLLNSKAQVLSKIPGGELKGLARQYAVTVPSKAKVAEIRAALEKALDFEQLSQHAEALNLETTEGHMKQRLNCKYELLDRTVRSCAHNEHRYSQIVDMGDRGYRPAIEWCDDIARKMAPLSGNKIPPFYPGDISSVESIPPKGSVLERSLERSSRASEWTAL